MNESNAHTQQLAQQREKNISSFLRNIEGDKEIIDPILALLYAGVQFMQLYAQSGNGKFYNMDMNKPKDRERITNLVKDIIHSTLSKDNTITKSESDKKKKKKKKDKKEKK